MTNRKKDAEEGSDTGTVISPGTGTGPLGMSNVSGEGQGNLTPDSGTNGQVDKESLVPCPDDDDTASENSSSPLAKKLPRKSRRRKANNK